MVSIVIEGALTDLEQALDIPDIIAARGSLQPHPSGASGRLFISVPADILPQFAAFGIVTVLKSEAEYLAGLQPQAPSSPTGPWDFSSLA